MRKVMWVVAGVRGSVRLKPSVFAFFLPAGERVFAFAQHHTDGDAGQIKRVTDVV